MFKPEKIPSELEVNNREKIPIEKLDRELKEGAERLKKMSEHSVGIGMIEMEDIIKEHPVLFFGFFEWAADIIENCNKERLSYLQYCYLMGEITDKEMQELKEDYFHPYLEKKANGKE